VDNGELDHYLLFTNRRISGNADARVRNDLIAATGATSVHVFGLERIGQVLKQFPNLVPEYGLADLAGPPHVHPDDLAEIICAFVDQREVVCQSATPIEDLRRVEFASKNIANGLSEGFANTIKQRYLPSFALIKTFLAHPDNHEIQVRYDSAAAEIHDQLIASRGQLDFDDFLARTQKLLFDRDSDLSKNKTATKLVLYYMYWNCDFGDS
jgi:C-terminal domain 12 of the ABC-three component (ABC-3C) systems